MTACWIIKKEKTAFSDLNRKLEGAPEKDSKKIDGHLLVKLLFRGQIGHLKCNKSILMK